MAAQLIVSCGPVERVLEVFGRPASSRAPVEVPDLVVASLGAINDNDKETQRSPTICR